MEICEVCGKGDDDENIILCDKCSCGFHLYCLDPPLHSVPAGEWFCSMCLKESFGFGSTRVFKFHQFERQAHAFKHAFFEPWAQEAADADPTAKKPKKKKKTESDFIAASHNAEERAKTMKRLPELASEDCPRAHRALRLQSFPRKT